jgi:catechol 2,3-dioxygenase-like lactoylglutathione lyase family enzyme
MKFAYTILYVRDVGLSLSFYESAFGLQRRFLHESGMYGELETGSTALAFAAESLAQSNLAGGFQPADPSRPPAASEVGLATPDVPAAYERALRAGAASAAAPRTKPWGQVVAYVRDLDGHLIELCTPMSP